MNKKYLFLLMIIISLHGVMAQVKIKESIILNEQRYGKNLLSGKTFQFK